MQVLTLNTWGVWLVAKKREERMRALATALRACTADVVLLQEVWVDSDARELMAAGKAAGLAHSTHFRSGMFGSGLVTLSRYPIRQMGFWKYAASGGSLELHQGDFHAGKGVGWVRVATPSGEVDVLNTHMHANYSHVYHAPPRAARDGAMAADPDAQIPADGNAGTRIAQVLELAQVVALVAGTSPGSTVGGSRPLIVGGDFNSIIGTLENNLWRQMVPWLKDAWAVAAKREAPEDNPDGLTAQAPGNSFNSYKQIPERIDYVWTDLPCTRAAVALTHKTASGASLSDHFAVSADLSLDAPRPAAATPQGSPMKGLFRRSGSQSAAAAASPALAAGLSEAAGRTALFGAAALLEQDIYTLPTSAAVKAGAGGCFVVGVLYCAIMMPVFMPWIFLEGAWLSAAMAAAGLMSALGVVLFLAGRIGDMSQQRAISNAYKQLRLFMEVHQIQLLGSEPAAVAEQ